MIIDIAIPFHGDVDLFKLSVCSVLAQSSDSWRLLIINDGHPDRGVDHWVTNLEENRITYVRNEKNLGPSLNYSKCIEMVSGSHCIILGADDILCQDYVEKIIKAINANPGSDFYHPKVNVIDEFGKEYLPLVDKIKRMLFPGNSKIVELSSDRALLALMLGNWMYFPAITWKIDTLRNYGFRPDLNVCQDFWLITQILLSGGKFSVVPEVLFNYRRFSSSDSSLKLLNGVRFAEEKLVYNTISSQTWTSKLRFVSFVAKLHLTSRMHALSLLPTAIFRRKTPKFLLRHLFT